MITQQLRKINHKKILQSYAFMTMGVTGFLLSLASGKDISHTLAMMSLTALTLPYFIFEKQTKNKLEQYLDNPLGAKLGYKREFSAWFNNYIDDSQCDSEKKYKVILTSFALNKMDISASSVFKSPLTLSSEVAEKYHIVNTKNEPVMLFSEHRINYQELVAEDFKDSQKLNIAKKVFQDFDNLGIMGKTVARCFGFNSGIEFIIPLQDFYLTPLDIVYIKRQTDVLNAVAKEELRGNMPAVEKEKDFIYAVIDKNPQYLAELTQFYAIRHTRYLDGKLQSSWPELIEHLDKLNAISDMRCRLETHLSAKEPIKRKKI